MIHPGRTVVSTVTVGSLQIPWPEQALLCVGQCVTVGLFGLGPMLAASFPGKTMQHLRMHYCMLAQHTGCASQMLGPSRLQPAQAASLKQHAQQPTLRQSCSTATVHTEHFIALQAAKHDYMHGGGAQLRRRCAGSLPGRACNMMFRVNFTL